MPSSHLILCRPLLLLPPIPPSIRVFSNKSTLRMRWPNHRYSTVKLFPCKAKGNTQMNKTWPKDRVGLPRRLNTKESVCSAGATGATGSIPRGGQGNPLQFLAWDMGACWATGHGAAKSQTRLKPLSRSKARERESRQPGVFKKKLLFHTTNLCRNNRKCTTYFLTFNTRKEEKHCSSFTKQVNCDNIIACIPWHILNRIQSYREKKAADINSTFQELLL